MIIVNQKRNRKIDMVFEFEDNILTLFGSYFWRFKFHLEIISVFVISTIGLQGLIGGPKIVYMSRRRLWMVSKKNYHLRNPIWVEIGQEIYSRKDP